MNISKKLERVKREHTRIKTMRLHLFFLPDESLEKMAEVERMLLE